MESKEIENTTKEPVTLADSLIRKAIDKGLSVEAIEKLMVLRKQLREEYAKDMYFTSLVNFQHACPSIPKEKVVNVTTKKGGHYSYSYAPIDIISKVATPVLHQFGFSYFIQTVTNMQNGTVTAIAVLHHNYGHQEISTFTIPIDTATRMNGMQRAESSLTYAKRIAFCNVTGILSAEEDTNVSEIEPEDIDKPDGTEGLDLDENSKDNDVVDLDFDNIPDNKEKKQPLKDKMDDMPDELFEVEEKDFGSPLL